MASSVLKPISLSIDLGVARRNIDPILAQRLSVRSPPPSPGKDGSAPPSPTKEQRLSQAAKLHEAHVQSIKERAERDLARLEEAKSRRRRVEAAATAKIEKVMHQADLKLEERKREKEAKRQEAKAKRVALAERVNDNRARTDEAKRQRGAMQAAACEAAALKHSRSLQSSVERASAEVKHALQVAADLKEKEKSALAAKEEWIAERQAAAEARRETNLKNKSPSSPTRTRVSKVLNDAKVECGLKRRSLFAAMEKAASNREAAINEVKEKATAHLTHVKEKVQEKVEAKKTELHKQTMERLVSADIARASALKLRYGALKPEKESQLLLIFDPTPVEALKAPPSALLKRLAATSRSLLATSAARHAGAAARRRAITAKRTVAAAKTAIRAAAAASKRGLALALQTQKIEGRLSRSNGVLGLRAASRARAIATFKQRHAAAAALRAAAKAAHAAKYAALDAKCSAAKERHAFAMRCRAKKEVHAAQAKTFEKRRVSQAEAVARLGARKAIRMQAAAEKKADRLATIVAIAKASGALGPIKSGKKAVSFAANAAKPPTKTAAIKKLQLLVTKCRKQLRAPYKEATLSLQAAARRMLAQKAVSAMRKEAAVTVA